MLFWSDYAWVVDREGSVMAVPYRHCWFYGRSVVVILVLAVLAVFVGFMRLANSSALQDVGVALVASAVLLVGSLTALMVLWRQHPPVILWKGRRLADVDPMLAHRAVSILNRARADARASTAVMPFGNELRRINDPLETENMLHLIVCTGADRERLNSVVAQSGLLAMSVLRRGREVGRQVHQLGFADRAEVLDQAAVRTLKLSLAGRREAFELFDIVGAVMSANTRDGDEEAQLDNTDVTVQVIDNVIAGLDDLMPPAMRTRAYLESLVTQTSRRRTRAGRSAS